jgi:hypothetical protein
MKTENPQKTKADKRAAALRENLKKRKAKKQPKEALKEPKK